jgi:threonine synthase
LKYISTRGAAPKLDFDDVLLAGLADDGGLYVPQRWPALTAADLDSFQGLDYGTLALRVMRPFVGGRIGDDAFERIVRESYAGFDHAAVTPLRQLDAATWFLELFHGPTLAFKDVALQLVGRLFDHVLRARGRRITIVGATSGDTGSAAIEACRDRDAIEIFILFPKGRVSEVQRRQMTTVASANVHTIAIEGTFDDCQDLVKAMFADRPFREALSLSAVNSINWARVMAQIVYYVFAAVALGAPARRVSFAVPTGNFGNVYAGYAAANMGLPVDHLVVGSNVNDILARFLAGDEMELRPVVPSLSPSMDIQVSSNFERLVFDLFDREGAATAAALAAFRRDGRLSLGPERWRRARRWFEGFRLDDEGTLAEIARSYRDTGELIDPHSAVGIAAGRSSARDRAVPMICLGTAHPAKFPDAIERAVGVRPALPPRLAELFERPERMTTLPNDLAVVEDFVRAQALEAA